MLRTGLISMLVLSSAVLVIPTAIAPDVYCATNSDQGGYSKQCVGYRNGASSSLTLPSCVYYRTESGYHHNGSEVPVYQTEYEHCVLPQGVPTP